ncbi:aldo/keto reductase [Salegentibacter sp. F188]|uniref:Aldo/keto reductase n=1 Tax=Autumnicola patrickiae TaxID=3075591 RepID=A0ABU3E1C9_9FLAO|nr:aldo/keto reductase [Salegentibacter sp. F188]MDT0689809.1 aldo/keto reductase [Salegentibacter sp. F188]
MKVSEKLGLGTVQFGLSYGISNKHGKTSKEEVQKILSSARENGIEMLDSASAYGNAEEVLGTSHISSFKLVSKFLPPLEGEKVLDQLRKSFENLRLDHIYGYLAHRPIELLNHPEQWEELQNFKAEGTVEKIGFSLNEPEELEKLLEKGYKPDLVQVPYNYFDRRFESAIQKLKEQGCEIHTRSAFLQGLFFMDPNELSEYFDEVKSLLKQLREIELLNGALLKFVLERPFIDKVITGVENEAQLLQNIDSIEKAPALPKLTETVSDNVLIPSRWAKS